MNKVNILLKKSIPLPLRIALKKILLQLHLPEFLYTRHVFKNAKTTPEYIPAPQLSLLNAHYPKLPEYPYDPASLLKRGQERSRLLMKIRGVSACNSFMEIGCGDGMVSYCLKRAGKEVTAVDLSDNHFDTRAKAAGVDFHVMSASALQFPDNYVDVVFSFNAFEHFSDPEKVLDQLTRITKLGGFIYLNFGPLYHSPWGEHAYRSFTVPYCQFLFTRETLNTFAAKEGLEPIEEGYVNGLPYDYYRSLFTSFSARLEVVKTTRTRNYSHLDLIRKHPSCFKSKNSNLINFVISEMEIVFRKK